MDAWTYLDNKMIEQGLVLEAAQSAEVEDIKRR